MFGIQNNLKSYLLDFYKLDIEYNIFLEYIILKKYIFVTVYNFFEIQILIVTMIVNFYLLMTEIQV